MVHPFPYNLTGAWSRTLLRRGGATDRTSSVTWLQAGAGYVDLRRPAAAPATTEMDELLLIAAREAFGGTITVDGNEVEWLRHVDLHPAGPMPDRGRLRQEGSLLVEDGVHADYVEYWERLPDTGESHLALQLSDPQDDTPAVLVRVGRRFGWARGRTEPLATGTDLREQVRGAASIAAARALLDVECTIGAVTDSGWQVQRSLQPAPAISLPRLHGDALVVGGRRWQVLSLDGDPDLLAATPQAEEAPA